jgi:hypothetical protein
MTNVVTFVSTQGLDVVHVRFCRATQFVRVNRHADEITLLHEDGSLRKIDLERVQ